MSPPSNLAIVGYGKMGRLIDQLAPEYAFTVTARLDVNRDEPLDNIQVAIEFSTPEAVIPNVTRLAERGVPVVIGTTGWLQHLDEVKSIATRHKRCILGSGKVWLGQYHRRLRSSRSGLRRPRRWRRCDSREWAR